MADGEVADDVRELMARKAGANAAAGYGVAPQAAQEAIRNAPTSGVPASVGMHAPEVGAQAASSSRDTAILGASPHVRSFAATSPAHAAASQPSWFNMAGLGAWAEDYVFGPYREAAGGVGQAFGAYNAQLQAPRTPGLAGPLVDQFKDTQRFFGLLGSLNQFSQTVGSPGFAQAQRGAVQGMYAGFGKEATDKLLSTLNLAMLALHAPEAVGGLPAVGGASAGEAMRPVAPPPHPIVGGWQVGESGAILHPDGSPVEFQSAKDAAKWTVQANRIMPGEAPPAIVANADGTFGLQAGARVPPPGVSPEADEVHAAQAEMRAQQVTAGQEAVANTPLHSEAPGLMEEFLNSHTPLGSQSAWVPPQALVDLWAQGHTPFIDRGGEVQEALQTGREVEVPLGTYQAEVAGKPYADALNAAARFSPEGVSVEEVKDLKPPTEAEGAKPSAPVEVPPDLTAHEAPIRALAAEAERAVEEVFKAHGIEALFEDASAAGMTKPQFERYGQRVDELRASIKQRLLERTYAQLRRERTPEWKKQLDAIVPFMEQDLNARPDVRALRELSAKGMKLDRGTVEDFYPGAASRLPPSVLKNNGNHPDAAADLLGFNSGAELVNALADLKDVVRAQSLNAWVKGAALEAAQSQARFNLGYDPSPEGLLASAREMVVESPMETYLTDDLRSLAQASGLPFSKSDIKAFAQEQFNRLPTSQAISTPTFIQGMRRTGERTQVALEKGKWAEAFQSRQHQLINYLQLQMSVQARKFFNRMQGMMQGWVGEDVIPSTDPLVGAILQQEVARVGFRLGRDAEELGRFLALAKAEGRPTTVPELHAVAESQGEVIDAAEPPGPDGLRAMPWEGYTAYTNSLQALQRFGKELQSITSHGRQWALLDFTNAVAQNADRIGRKFTPQQLHDIQAGTSNELMDVFRRLSMTTQSLLVGQLRPEVYLHWVDGDRQGPLMGLVNGLQEGKYTETDLSSGWVEKMKAAVPSRFWRQQKELLTSPPEMMAQTSHGPVNVLQTRGNLRMALTYLGSVSAREKLLGGYGWGEAGEQWLLRNATKEDWDFVRAFWAENARLFKIADEKYMARRGYGLKEDVLRDVDTGLAEVGVIPGGHVHVTYDLTLKERMRVEPVDGLRMQYGTARPGGDVMDSHPAASLPSAFYTEKRTGYVGPVNLDPRALAAGVSEVIHDIAYRDALINAQKGLTQPAVRDALESVLGPEYEKQMLPWLRYIASERMLYDPSTNTLSRGIARLNHNASFSMMAFQVSSSLKHGGVGLIHMAAEVKDPLALAGAVRDTWGLGPRADMWRKFVVDNSGEVRGLRFNNDASLAGVLQQSALTGDAEAQYRRWGYALFTFSKFYEAQATWLAKYRVAINENGNHGLSVEIANKAVRDTQGAGHAVDQAPLLRNIDHPAAQLGRRVAGMFMGFRNTTTNRLFTAKRQAGLGLRQLREGDAQEGAANLSKAGVGTFAFVVMAALWVAYEETFIRGSGQQKKGKGAVDHFGEEVGWELGGQTVGSLIGPNFLFDAAHYTSGQMDQIKATVGHLAKGELDKIHGGIRLATSVVGQATGAIPASAGNFAQAIADEFSGDLKKEDTGAVPFFQRAILGRTPHYKPNRRSH